MKIKLPEHEFNSFRSPVISINGMVATSQPLAVSAGLEVLRNGGNAADAAIVAAAALNVTEPTSTGIGGDMFALYFKADTKEMFALNGSGKSPAGLTMDMVKAAGFTESLPNFHPYTITVPGAAAGWCDLNERLGVLPMTDVLAPAVRLAEEGFPVAPLTSQFWARGAERQLIPGPNGNELLIEGRAPKVGEVFKNPGLAKTFRKVSAEGKKGFYTGEIADAIVDVIHSQGGVMTLEDLANHESIWAEPISTVYKGYRVWECPPNGQGLAALMALNVLEEMGMEETPPGSAERLHLQIEAMRIAFADTRWFITDPEKNPAPLRELLSKEYAAERRKLLNREKAVVDQQTGTPTSSTDTVYLSVVDGAGNACSFIISNYMGFGTGFVPRSWGFTLQNRGHGFNLEEGHPNQLAPSKRPYHTIIPAMITHEDTGELFASYGVMGGFMQPQGHMQVAVNLIDDQMDPQTALDQPRFCITTGDAGGKVALENGIEVEVMAALAKMGHTVVPTSGLGRAIFGRGQIILRDRETGVLWGGSDPRADGLAMTV